MWTYQKRNDHKEKSNCAAPDSTQDLFVKDVFPAFEGRPVACDLAPKEKFRRNEEKSQKKQQT